MYTVCLPDQPPATFMISGARCDRPVPRARLALRRVDASVPSLEHILKELPVPLLMIDPRTTTMLAVNRAAERLSGCVATDLLGNPLETLVTGLDANAKLHRPGGRSVPVQIIRSCNDQTATGPTAVALLDQRPYSDGHRREAAMRTTLTRQMEELELLRKQLDEVSGVRTQFLSAAAHELKTPLTVVQSYLEILLSDMTQGLGQDQLSFLRIAYDSVLRLRHLVVDLVDLAALESGRLQLDICRIDVGQLLAATTDEMKPLADRAGLQLERGGAAPLPSIRGDRDRVQQVLRNLVDNAIKNTPAGGRIAVDVHADQDTVVLTVEDSGVGIPGDELASIFDEFVQVRRGPDDRPRGTGLGLAICRRIVRALGGRITVDSSEGRGSVFAVHLPMWPQEDHE